MELKKCCVCGMEFNGYGNNPDPVYEKYSMEACCDSCNFRAVIPARIEERATSLGNDPKLVREGDILSIMWTKESDAPTKYLLEEGKLLKGKVSKITKTDFIGNWGDFKVNIENDRWFVSNRN